ncbi:MAG: methylenetetrahydrofolate reductase [Acidimicrobiales bacterium]
MTYELIPLKNVRDQEAFLPANSTMSVTCSPAKTIDDTLDLCAEFAAQGHTTIPHFAARMVESQEHVEHIVKRVNEQGIKKVFIIGGDADQRGPFYDAASFMRAFFALSPNIDTVGIGCYPDGHQGIPDQALLDALREKQTLITEAGYHGYIATQMCFDPNKIKSWLSEQRATGLTLPCHIGVPGAIDRTRLITISLRLGIGHSARYLKKNNSSVIRLLSPGGYNPSKLLAQLSNHANKLNITNIHCFTFNAVDTTEDWRLKTLAKIKN